MLKLSSSHYQSRLAAANCYTDLAYQPHG